MPNMLRLYEISFSYFSSNKIFYLKKKYCLYVTESNTCTVQVNNGISNFEAGWVGVGWLSCYTSVNCFYLHVFKDRYILYSSTTPKRVVNVDRIVLDCVFLFMKYILLLNCKMN